MRYNLFAAVFGVASTIGTIAQNDMRFSDLDPNSTAINAAKGITSLCSLACLICIYRIHWASVLAARLFEHLRRGTHFDEDVPLGVVLRRPFLWVEVLVCIAFCPPWVSGEVSTEFLGNIIVYRFETLGCVAAFMRLYLCWRTLVDKFVAEMPDSKVSISTYNGIKLDSKFFLKKMLNSWTAIKFIVAIWFCVLLICGYLFRITEATCCLLRYTSHPDCRLPRAKVWILNGIEFDKVFCRVSCSSPCTSVHAMLFSCICEQQHSP